MRRPWRAVLVTSAFISFSGCAVGPDYQLPTVAVPTEFRTASLTPAIASAPTTGEFVRWWQVLHDPQLNWLIEQAIASNPDIEIALTRVQEARLQQNVVLGAMLPAVAGRGGIATGSAGDLMRSRAGLALRAGDSTHGFRAIREWPASMPHGSSICSAKSSARSRPQLMIPRHRSTCATRY